MTSAKKVLFFKALKVAFFTLVDAVVVIAKLVVGRVSRQKYRTLFTNANQIRYHSQNKDNNDYHYT